MADSRQKKTALVLAGGGLTGAVYEIGALRAIDDLLIDRTVNDFDIFVGTSAGALVSAFLANGVSPEEMYQVIDGKHPQAASIDRNQIFKLNWYDYLQWGVQLPSKLASAWAHYLHNLRDITLVDLFWSLSQALPTGLYDINGLANFIHQGLTQLGCMESFSELDKKLLITATELDSGERAVFGAGYYDVPISAAVAASSAFPLVYTPMRVGEHDYIDGGARGNASIDLAIEHGAKLIVCINPLVPFDHEMKEEADFHETDPRYLSETGVQSILNQVFRIMLHSGLQYHIKQTKKSHPEVDIILIEPSPQDYKMFSYNIMRYSARLIVAHHGFESVTVKLAETYQEYRKTLERHGIPISRQLVIEELNEIAESGHNPEVVRRILEAKTLNSSDLRRKKPVYRLSDSLAELESVLNNYQQQ